MAAHLIPGKVGVEGTKGAWHWIISLESFDMSSWKDMFEMDFS